MPRRDITGSDARPQGFDGQRRYARHRPEDTVFYPIVEQHAGAFFDAMTEQGASLPGCHILAR